MLVVMADGLNRVESEYAGDLAEPKVNALLGGLVKVKHKLVNLKP